MKNWKNWYHLHCKLFLFFHLNSYPLIHQNSLKVSSFISTRPAPFVSIHSFLVVFPPSFISLYFLSYLLLLLLSFLLCFFFSETGFVLSLSVSVASSIVVMSLLFLLISWHLTLSNCFFLVSTCLLSPASPCCHRWLVWPLLLWHYFDLSLWCFGFRYLVLWLSLRESVLRLRLLLNTRNSPVDIYHETEEVPGMVLVRE